MRICLVTNEKLGESIRLEKQARTLLASGHELVLVCWADRRVLRQRFCETVPVYGIVRSRSWLATKLLTQVYKVFYIELFGLLAILRVVHSFRPHIILVRDFDLVGTVLATSKLSNFKMIYDVNDLVSYRMLSNLQISKVDWISELLNKLNRPFVGLARVRRLESRYFRTVDRITVPFDHYKEKMLAMGVSCDNIAVLPNYEDLAWRQDELRDPTILQRYEGQFVISYIGAFYPRRGIDVLIRAMPMVVEQVSEAKLVLVGPVRDIEADLELSLKRLVREMALSDYVEFTGTVPTKAVFTYIDVSDVGVIPFRDTIHTRVAVGHKVFMYMAAGKPLVVTDLRGQAQIMRQEGCGLVVPPDDPQHLAVALVDLYRNPGLRHFLGEKGRKAVQQRYNWASGSQEFIRMINALTKEC